MAAARAAEKKEKEQARNDAAAAKAAAKAAKAAKQEVAAAARQVAVAAPDAADGGPSRKRMRPEDGGDEPPSKSQRQDEPGTAAEPARAKGEKRVSFTDQCTAFVKKLAPEVVEADVEGLLSGCGDVKAVRMPRDAASGRTRGFAYVECGDRGTLAKVVAMDGTELKGMKLMVAESRAPGGKGGKGAGRGAGRGGRGGGRGSGAPGGEPGTASRGAPTLFTPRNVRAAPPAEGSGPRSNADFRELLLARGKGGDQGNGDAAAN